MNISLIHGNFTAHEAMDIITEMIHIKIKFHESKISQVENQEDNKMREKRIKQLQKDLYELRQAMEKNEAVSLEAVINISTTKK